MSINVDEESVRCLLQLAQFMMMLSGTQLQAFVLVNVTPSRLPTHAGAMAHLPLVLTLGLGALAGVAHGQAIIGDGSVILGVGAAGFLNVPYAATGGDVNLPVVDPANEGVLGLRNPAGDITALEKGRPSEGWGCGIRNGGPGSEFLDECAAESNGFADGNLFNVEVRFSRRVPAMTTFCAVVCTSA